MKRARIEILYSISISPHVWTYRQPRVCRFGANNGLTSCAKAGGGENLAQLVSCILGLFEEHSSCVVDNIVWDNAERGGGMTSCSTISRLPVTFGPNDGLRDS